VFTDPAVIGAIYALLFNAAADTLTTTAADRKHLGADQSSRMGC
jgi:hypothetical protein